MSVERDVGYLQSLLRELRALPQETEWVEFKQSNDDAPLIGEYISALANAAALLGKQYGYLLWGIDDASHAVIGTAFKPSATRYKQQELESWLLQKTAPNVRELDNKKEQIGRAHV